MASEHTLVAMFESDKATLEKALIGLTLPKDGEKIQKIVANYFDTLFNKDGDFRQNLTLGEDYILQAALSLLNAQQEIGMKLREKEGKSHIQTNVSQNPLQKESRKIPFVEKEIPNISVDGVNSLLSAGGGALVGKVILGGWGAVFGAIAGTALLLYLSLPENKLTAKRNTVPMAFLSESSNTPLEIGAFFHVIYKVCQSVDNLIDTFRAQINRVVQKYESQEKPTIEKEYRTLLEGIQTLVGYKRAHNSDEEKYVKKLQERIEDVAELLDNYDLAVEDYTEENAHWFETIPSANVQSLKMVYPAIVKNGTVILLGKIFIPENK